MAELESIIKGWAQAYQEEVLQFAQPPTVDDAEVFGSVYHSLIHSPLSQTLLQLEASYAAAVESLCRESQARLSELEARQNSEMVETLAAAAKSPGPGSVSEADVSALASHHMDTRQLMETKAESQLEMLQEQQAREFRTWVMTVHEEYKTSGGLPPQVPRSDSSFSLGSQGESVTVLSESFTITLGSQMKLMHNLRVSAAKVLDLLRYPGGCEDALPQRLNTSLSLYSSSLCGLVLLTDNRINNPAPQSLESEFRSLVRRAGTEFHFPSMSQQVDSVRGELARAATQRLELRRRKEGLEGEGDTGHKEGELLTGLQTGDFYLTRHSNLCETHVVFHLVVDSTVEGGNISSRHPTIMGLRHLIKTACMCGVTSLTIPLLLTHTMTECMTVAWCVKRAELVFKCIKGFMMEMTGWGGEDIKTMHFLLPAEIDPTVFSKLSNMLSTIFRVSNPIRGN